MRYFAFIFGEPVAFEVSRTSTPKAVAERLKPRLGSRFWPFHFEKVVGWVSEERLSVEWRGGAFSSNMSPRLRGRLIATGLGTRFDGSFGAPVALRFFLPAWLCFDLFFVSMFVAKGVPSGEGRWAALAVFPFIAIHAAFPFGLAALGMIGADTIRQRLIDFVASVGEPAPGQSHASAA